MLLHSPLPSRLLLLVFVLSSTLAGCARFQERKATEDPWVQYAESRFSAGDYAGAAEIFESMAGKSSAPDHYRLRAADAHLRAGENAAAQALITSINANQLDDVDQVDFHLLAARLNLNAGRATQAMGELNRIAKTPRTKAQEVHYHLLRASANNQLGDMLGSARERVAVGPMLTTADATQNNNEAIYDALSRLPDSVLQNQSPPAPDRLGGWMQLTHILRTSPAAELGADLGAWRNRYLRHPADGPFLDRVLEESGRHVQIQAAPSVRAEAPSTAPETASTPRKAASPFIGVMIPLSGPFAPAGEAIRSGMLASFYADGSPTKLPLKFADSESSGVEQLYRSLTSQGAAVGVGPLIKEEVGKLIRVPDRTVPVLALNQVQDATAESVVQFGLSPEQEVEQAAGAAWFDGRQRAVLLAPASAFGERLSSHFARYWRSLGGKLVATKTYSPNAGDYSTTAAQVALAVGVSPNPVDSVSGEALKSDFIFLIANPHDARLIKPQIDAQRLSGFPVYATSHVFSGRPDGQQDRDLDGIYFCDIPWLLHSYDNGPLSSSALAPEIAKTSPEFVKLIALGIDAYRMAKMIPTMTPTDSHLFDGATGLLTLQSGNWVQRQMECAQFEGGMPQARGLAPILRPTASSTP